MNITKNYKGKFGELDVYEYILSNNHNMNVHILSFGSTITEINLPGEPITTNVVLSYANWEDYQSNSIRAGSSLGPNAGRILDAMLPIDGNVYELSKNNGNHNIHGGFHNFATKNWKEVEFFLAEDSVVLKMQLFAEDGLDGFPGNRNIKLTYTLTNNNELSLHYYATSDKTTYFNLSNHSYFNLSGNLGTSALEQELMIHADLYVENNKEHISTGYKPVVETPFNYRISTRINKQIQMYPNNDQLIQGRGYNNGFLIRDCSESKIKHALTLQDNNTNRKLHLHTDAPCVVVYSGGFIGNKYTLTNHINSTDSCAIAFEAQDCPNAPHIPDFDFNPTHPNSAYERTIIYKFEY